MDTYKSKEYDRNYGFWNEAEQKRLNESKVSIAGVGGDGFQLGHKLAMMGILNFRVADPEVFEPENSNRVFGAKTSTYGCNKAEVFRDMVMDIRPEAKVTVYNEGVNTDNIDEFIGDSDLVFDESELTHLELGAMIARKAREKRIPNIWAINLGFSGIVTSFHPTNGITFEKMMGISEKAPLDEIKDMKVDFSRCLPYIPKYGDIQSLIAVQNGASLPSISQGVDVASALGTTEAFLHLTQDLGNHRKKPTWAPKFRYMDAYTGESGVIRNPRASYYLGMMTLIGRLKLGINPFASYSDKDRKNREI
jgi:molybdopterin/thiamine biosynthesis adenylyltransferase